MKDSTKSTYLKLWKQGYELCIRHLAEFWPFQGKATLCEDATLLGDVASRVNIVASDHPHKNAGPSAGSHRCRHLLSHRILCTKDEPLKLLGSYEMLSHITFKRITDLKECEACLAYKGSASHEEFKSFYGIKEGLCLSLYSAVSHDAL